VWQALKNAVIPLSPNGLFYLALYSENRYRDGALAGHPGPEFWLRLKKDYNRAKRLGRWLIEARHLYRSYFAPFAPNLLQGWRNLQKARARYRAEARGMDFWTDMRDWLGGYPMEFVKEKDCVRLLKGLGLDTLRLCCGQGNSEYLLRPAKARNSWDGKLKKRSWQTLNPPFCHEGGYSYSCPWPGELDLLWEDDLPAGFNASSPAAVARFGEGRNCLAQGRLYFSAADNSNPNDNGKRYAVSYYDH
jgi:hypothetical protein